MAHKRRKSLSLSLVSVRLKIPVQDKDGYRIGPRGVSLSEYWLDPVSSANEVRMACRKTLICRMAKRDLWVVPCVTRLVDLEH